MSFNHSCVLLKCELCNQVASRVLQVPISKIRVDETSTATVPNAFASNASVSSDLYAAAVMVSGETVQIA